MRMRAALSWSLALSLVALAARAQPPLPPPTPAPGSAAEPGADAAPPAAPPATPAGSKLEDFPPSLRLGMRTAFVQSRMPTNPMVVVVPDERSFVAAVGSWSLDAGVRFPVLIDDGSWPARQAVARFVRAFKPRSVVRWSAPEGVPALPADAGARQAIIEGAAARPWGVGGEGAAALSGEALFTALKARWAGIKFIPPGIVVASANDPAWPAALTLACARGQPILWTSIPGDPSGHMPLEDADAFERRVEAFAEASGWKWGALGDELESVTICLNCPTKIFLGDPARGDGRAMLALTDVVGRKPAPPEDKARKDRWAWAGQIIGGTWSSAYAAMSAVFLRPESAWLFDGYDATPPWSAFDCTEAATLLERAGLKTTVDDGDRRSLGAWRKRAAGKPAGKAAEGEPAAPPDGPGCGVWADLIAVNTSGNQDFFDLKPGQAKPGDVPILARPAIVHFVHSWSAAAPSDPATVAGRWLSRGAYAYVGSVHEPYLQAFVPTPKFAGRMVVGLPLGAAARLDNGEVWKVNVLGDPLITLGRAAGIAPGPVLNRPLPLEGARDVQEGLAAALREGDFARALADLTLLGRDRDAARLLGSVLKERPGALTPGAALAGLGGAFFAGELHALGAAYLAAGPLLAGEESVRAGGLHDARDMLWHALYPRLDVLTTEQARALATALRAETLVRDAQEAHPAVRAAVTPEAAAELLKRARARATTGDQRHQIGQIGKQ